MDRPSDDDFRSYLDAARKGDIRDVTAFLNQFPAAIDDHPWFVDTTALLEAASRGKKAVIELLLDHGADINKCDGVNFSTPLMSAAFADKDCVILLLDRGADLEAKNRIGQTALTSLASCGRDEMIGLLLDRGADISAGNKDGFTPLRTAAHYGHASTVKLLIERGALADINRQDRMGYTPLMWAANCGSAPMVRTLLEYGAKVDLRNEEGKTAIDVALSRGHSHIAELLRSSVPAGPSTQRKEAAPVPDARAGALDRLKQRASKSIHLKPRPPQ